MNKLASGVALAALLSSALSAQTVETTPLTVAVPTTTPEPTPPPPPAPDLTLNAGTPITLAVAEEVNSSTHREGGIFKLTVLNDVAIGQTVVIPRGTPASAEITWRTGKGAFGKSGKIEFDLRSIDLGGQQIPLTGSFRQEGEGNTVATGVGLLAIGIFAGFITGKRARLPVGRELMSQLAQPVAFSPNGRIAVSFDSKAAVAAAAAATPIGLCRTAANGLEIKKRENALEKCFTERME